MRPPPPKFLPLASQVRTWYVLSMETPKQRMERTVQAARDAGYRAKFVDSEAWGGLRSDAELGHSALSVLRYAWDGWAVFVDQRVWFVLVPMLRGEVTTRCGPHEAHLPSGGYIEVIPDDEAERHKVRYLMQGAG